MATQQEDIRVVKHYLGKIDYQSRTQGVSDENISEDRVITIEELYDYIFEIIGFSKEYSKGKLCFTLEHIKKIDNHLALMINILDKSKATTVLKNQNTKERTEITPNISKGQGYEYSCHILIDLTPNKNKNYNVLIEQVNKISQQIINLFINKVLFQIAKTNEVRFSCSPRYQDKNLKHIKYKPVITLNSKPCDDFLNDIRHGTISNVTLIKEKHIDISIPDSHQIIRPKDFKMSIDTSIITQDSIGYLKSVCGYIMESEDYNFDKIKISYKKRGTKVASNTATLLVDGFVAESMDNLVTKKYILQNFENQLKDSYNEINTEIVKKMITEKEA
ncbi:hypothetical protein [Shewanella salipaludis]|uniref:Uncharacterized protein n=1 Tax=Shewanella salipaludis TaxID=2723052 RepID=A0A972JKB1_9GAMM|nr:hypothetical protein [Shewanella salipaludis]NMH64929.1 hypothetical protein [Shewanella salipaludis]